MVWFQCEDCGENLKKPKLPNHFNRCSARKLSCIDCGVIFNQQSVQTHTSCVTETVKYGPKVLNKDVSGDARVLKENNGKQSGPDVDLSLGLSTSSPWSCSLCNVKATSSETLELHSQGKKHRNRAKAIAASGPKEKNTATKVEGLEAVENSDLVACKSVGKEEVEDAGAKEKATAAAAAPSTMDTSDPALGKKKQKEEARGEAPESPPPGLQEKTKSEKKHDKKLKRHNVSAVAETGSKVLSCVDDGANKPLDHNVSVRVVPEKKRKHEGEEEQQKQQKRLGGASVNGENRDHKKKKNKKKEKHVVAAAYGGNDRQDHHDGKTTGTVVGGPNVLGILCMRESGENDEQAKKKDKKGSHKRKSSVHSDKAPDESNGHPNGAGAGLNEPPTLAGPTSIMESAVGHSLTTSTTTAHEKKYSGKKSKKLKLSPDSNDSAVAAPEIFGVNNVVEDVKRKIIANKEKSMKEKKATEVETSVHDVSFREWLGDEGGDVGGAAEGTPTHRSLFDLSSRKKTLKEDQQLLQPESYQVGGAGEVEGQSTQKRIARVVKWKKIMKEIIAKLVQSVNGKMKQKDMTRAVLPLAQKAIDSSALSVDRKALKAELMRQVRSSPKFVVDGKHIMQSHKVKGRT